jgi:putative transposase
VLRSNPLPRKIVTDQLRSYPAAKADIPELAHAKHVFVKAAARVNNRAENSHQPTRRCEPRHQMNAACHRVVLKERFATWHGWTVTAAVQEVI